MGALDDSATKVRIKFESTKNFDEKMINEVRRGFEGTKKERGFTERSPRIVVQYLYSTCTVFDCTTTVQRTNKN